ncbi:tetratricopeptide repeat protein [Azospirillum sp. sgz301742]
MTGIAIYDPRRLSEEDFLAGFIARNELADFLLGQLRQIPSCGEAKHRVIIGQRGMGKTSLLRRLAIGIKSDPGLATTLLPLTFREEQYNVRTLDRFWRNCGEALAEWLEQSGQGAEAQRLDRALCGPAWATADGAVENFLACVALTGKRPVLLVDNLDLVLDALPADEHWQLRRALQAPSGPILYGAATRALRQSGDPKAAFYEFFRMDLLEPLTEAELLQCMRRLAVSRGDAGKPVIAILDREPERLRVLHTLTGGNPRILALIYQLLERAESETVFADLEALLDQLTPFYKARVEELSTELQRSIFDAVALHWDPITSHDLSVAAGVEVTTVSSQLSRLKSFGLIEEVPTSGSRAGYQLVERFFNVWYLMRHGTRRTKQKMRWLTAFLQIFYTDGDLKRMRERFAQCTDSGRWGPLYAEALDAALEAMEGQVATGRAGGGLVRKRAAVASGVQGKRDAPTLFAAGVSHYKAGRLAEAEVAYRRSIELDPQYAWSWNNLGVVLMNRLGRPAEAEVAYRKAIRLDPQYALAWNNLGRLLMNRLGRPAEAEVACRRAIELDPQYARAWNNLGAVLMDHLGRPAEAAVAYRKVIRLDPQYVSAWNNLGRLLMNRLGRPAEAEVAYHRAIELDPQYAWAWNNLGVVLMDHLGRPAEAEVAYRRAIRLDPQHTLAWNNLGRLLMNCLGRPAEAEVAYRRAIELDPQYAWAWNNLGAVLMDHLGRPAEAEVAYRRAIELDPQYAWALNNLGAVLMDHLDHPAEAEVACRRAIELDPTNARVLNRLGNLLADHLRRPKDAERAYRRVVNLGGDILAMGQCNLLWLYLDTGRQTEAEVLRQEISNMALVGICLIDAGMEVSKDNFGASTRHLDAALALELDTPEVNCFDDLLRLLYLFERRGYGERLIAWMAETGHSDRHAPIYAAFVAYVRGERSLLDVNPEVRQPAQRIYNWLASRRHASEPPQPPPPKRRRGRPPKRISSP